MRNTNGGPPDAADVILLPISLMDDALVGFGQTVPPADCRRGSMSNFEAFVWFLREAQYAEGRCSIDGRPYELQRGELNGGVIRIASIWNWKPGRVRRFLDALEDAGLISRQLPSGGKSRGRVANTIRVVSFEMFRPLGDIKPTGQNVVHDTLSGRLDDTLSGRLEQQASNWKETTNDELQEQQRPVERQVARTVQQQVEQKGPLCSNTHAHVRISKPNKLSTYQGYNNPPCNPPPGSADDPGAAETRPPRARLDPPAKRGAGRAEALAAYERYNEVALKLGLPQARALTPSREKSILARMRDFGPESWDKALEALGEWKWGRGDNPSGWRASLDFVLQVSSYQKLVEGAYTGAPGASAAKANGHRSQKIYSTPSNGYDAMFSPEAQAAMHEAFGKGRG